MTTFAKQFTQWAQKGYFRDWKRYPERLDFVAGAIRAELSGLGAYDEIGSTELLRRLVPDADKKTQDYFVSGVHHVRETTKLLEGWFYRGTPNGGTFGKPSVKWINKSARGNLDANLEDMLK
jgi:hypothetical protein